MIVAHLKEQTLHIHAYNEIMHKNTKFASFFTCNIYILSNFHIMNAMIYFDIPLVKSSFRTLDIYYYILSGQNQTPHTHAHTHTRTHKNTHTHTHTGTKLNRFLLASLRVTSLRYTVLKIK